MVFRSGRRRPQFVVGDALVGEVEPAEERVVELSALVVGAALIDLDRVTGPTMGVVGGAVRGQCRQGVDDPLLAGKYSEFPCG